MSLRKVCLCTGASSILRFFHSMSGINRSPYEMF